MFYHKRCFCENTQTDLVITLLQIGLSIHKVNNCEGEEACRDQSQMKFHETVKARDRKLRK
jgi:hypothetical protein